MQKENENKKAQALARFLKRINRGEDPKLLCREAGRLITDLGPRDIATAEENLIHDGFSAQLAQQLSVAFMLMGVLEEHGGNIRAQLPANHVLQKVMVEHDMMRCFLADLQDVTEAIANMENLTDTKTEFRKLCHIVEHLDAMQEHIDREEDVIFPYLTRNGWSNLCQAAKSDHVYIKVAISDLTGLIGAFNNVKFKQFKVRLMSTVKYLCPIMYDHLSQEDNVMYPIALEVINRSDVWEKMKSICDEIGYCGIHL